MIVHAAARVLEGAFAWSLPLCWDAEQRQRNPDTADDDELWWLSVDQGAIDPFEVLVAYPPDNRAAVTCGDCLEWLHA